MKKRAVLFAGVLLLAVGSANAGVIRVAAKVVKGTAKVASQPVRHPVKDAKAVAHGASKVIW